QWNTKLKLPELRQSINAIYGNYVNFFMKKSRLDGDLWIFHDINNPMYFTHDTSANTWLIKSTYTEADEIAAHAVVMSPRIQHMHFSGVTQ
ncbi:MAG TPA: hypothetical protein PKM25_16100, partial [Candidatus Ozemobacteraceae bacterium]|nr:hypothetical protein [Candidatus Ozemobacteraceae bacterium]